MKQYVAHILTGFNLILLISYLSDKEVKSLRIYVEKPTGGLRHLLMAISTPYPLEVIELNGSTAKIVTIFSFLYKFKATRRQIFIKFTNYSFFGQWLHKTLGRSKCIFLDEGTTALNLIDRNMRYASAWREGLKRIFSPTNYEPNFSNFFGVDRAYLNCSAILNEAELGNIRSLHDTNEIFSFGSLRHIVNKAFPEMARELSAEAENILKVGSLVLGSSVVEHGFLTRVQYEGLLLETFSKSKNIKNIFKPHPNEKLTFCDKKIDNIKLWDTKGFPVELYLCFVTPKTVASFCSTTSFLLIGDSINAGIKLEIYVNKKMYSEELFKRLVEHYGNSGHHFLFV